MTQAPPDPKSPKPDPKASSAPAPVTQPPAKCYVKAQPSGGLSVTFQIDQPEAHRIKLRAGTMDLNRYIWENIVRPALFGHLY